MEERPAGYAQTGTGISHAGCVQNPLAISSTLSYSKPSAILTLVTTYPQQLWMSYVCMLPYEEWGLPVRRPRVQVSLPPVNCMKYHSTNMSTGYKIKLTLFLFLVFI